MYEAWDLHTRTRVALKVLHSDPVSGETQMPKAAVRREIECSGRLHHPNICRLLDAFLDDERSLVVMVVRACPYSRELGAQLTQWECPSGRQAHSLLL